MEVVSDQADQLGECPLWDWRTGTLYWVDIDGRAINSLRWGSEQREVRHPPGRPGSIALTPSPNHLLVAVEHRLWWLDWETATFTPWTILEAAGTGNRLNDGRCDPAGALWVGSMHERSADNVFSGMLHRVLPSGEAHTAQREIGVSNGLAFSPDGSSMYFADTLRTTVWVYAYDADTGSRSDERVFTDFTDLPGKPDGGCVDADGCYWTACVDGGAVARLTPAGGVDRIIELPVERPTMPAFGGPDLDTLFVTSIGGHRRLDGATVDGRLLALDPGVIGIPERLFAATPPDPRLMERSNPPG